MKVFKYIISIVFCVLGHWLSAQKTYAWMYLGNDGRNPRAYRMYDYDIFTGNATMLFELDSSRFVHPNINGNTFIINSFEYNKDKSIVYFLEREGDLYLYDIALDKITYIKDLSPENTDFNFHRFNLTTQIDFINDSLYYISGLTHGILNTKNFDFNIIRRCPSLAASFTPFEGKLFQFRLLLFKNQFIYIDSNLDLAAFDPYNPIDNMVLVDVDQFKYGYYDNNLISYQYGCDSTVLYTVNQKDIIDVDRIDIASGTITELYEHPPILPINIEVSGILDIQHYNSPEWEDCQRFVDLDKDDSTIDKQDYLVKDLCRHTDISLSDIDIQISNEQPLDSIYIQIVNPLFSQELNIPMGNYTLDQGPNFWNIIRNNGSSTNKDFENAIRSAVYTNWGPREGGEIRIGITPYHGGIAGKTAFAIYRIIDTLPNAGEDRLVSVCVSDSVLYLKSLVSPIDITDRFIWKGDSIDLFDFYAPRNDTLLYIKQRGICYDTAVVNIVIHDVPTALDLADTILCAGQKLDVDLTRIADDIVWNDGQLTKQKTFTSAGNYFYKATNSFGCVSQDSFALAYLPAAESIPIDTVICLDGIFRFQGKDYNLAGDYSAKVVNSRGCDSILYSIKLAYLEPQPIIIEGDLGLCPGESTILTISSKHKNIMLAQTPSEKSIIIDSAGTYSLSAIDKYGCPSDRTFEIISFTGPSVDADDLKDVIFSNDISFPVLYDGEINSYTWTPSDGSLSCDDCPFPLLVRVAGSQYVIEVIDENGCKARDTLSITYSSPEVFLPNVIGNKPNDLNNSRLYASGDVSGGTYEMSIYDRWGNLIYNEQGLEINNRSQGWHPDGRFEQGVYVYKIRYFYNGEFVTIYGNVALL